MKVTDLQLGEIVTLRDTPIQKVLLLLISLRIIAGVYILTEAGQTAEVHLF